MMSKHEWLGGAERIVFNVFKGCAPYVSPFSINNPGGWRYWLIHFANSHRARQVYNNVLHDNSSIQAHFGCSGLDMLAYDPRHDAADLFLFDDNGRQRSKTQLLDDIPKLVEAHGAGARSQRATPLPCTSYRCPGSLPTRRWKEMDGFEPSVPHAMDGILSSLAMRVLQAGR